MIPRVEFMRKRPGILREGRESELEQVVHNDEWIAQVVQEVADAAS